MTSRGLQRGLSKGLQGAAGARKELCSWMQLEFSNDSVLREAKRPSGNTELMEPGRPGSSEAREAKWEHRTKGAREPVNSDKMF